jgi:lipoate-protein ligase A
MAVDKALLATAPGDDSLPALRLYSWEPPCLSLGYGQKLEDVDQHRLGQQGWDLVRRPTGGKAILHTDELTYSVIGTRLDPRLAGGIQESYRVLANALEAALQRLGVAVEIKDGAESLPDLAEAGAVCFDSPSAYEITVGGRKLVGSAQARRGEAILQHGSIPLTGDISRITRVLHYPNARERDQARLRVLDRATTVEAAAGRIVDWEEMAGAMKAAFSDSLNLNLVTSELTDAEKAQAEDQMFRN